MFNIQGYDLHLDEDMLRDYAKLLGYDYDNQFDKEGFEFDLSCSACMIFHKSEFKSVMEAYRTHLVEEALTDLIQADLSHFSLSNEREEE